LTGSFEVREIIYGADDAIESFWATFEQHCEGTAPALTGDIRIKANVPEIKATISSSSNPSSFGQPVTFSSVVTGSAGTPTGQVAFVEGSLTDGARIIGTDILSGSPASSKITRSGLNTGMHSLKAVYLGDAGFPSFSSYALNQNVTKARTNTNIKSSENTVKFGEPVVFTATVTGASGAPKGFVIFKDGSSVLGTVALSGNPSVAAFTTSSLSAGIHSITAVYEGGLNYYTSVSNSLFQFVSIWP
jgi:hypothetical protein